MRYGEGRQAVTALDGISLRVEEQEFVAIVGPSGCGKSTLLYLVGGFLRPTAGQIRLRGRPVRGPGPDRGIVFQRYSLFPWRTVRGNIAYGLEEKGLPQAERERIVADYVRLVHLEGFEDRYPRELSGGMQQRVALAQTLACDPAILLMDEPFGALDAQTRRLLQAELRGIWRREKKTVLFVTHDVEEAVALGTRVVVLSARPGTVKAVFTRDFEVADGDEFEAVPGFAALKLAVWRSVREEVERGRRVSPAAVSRLAAALARLTPLAAVLALWQVASVAGLLPARLAPSALDVARALARLLLTGEILPHTLASLARAGTGFGVAVVGGVAVGLLMARLGWVERLVDPVLLLLYPLPKPVLIPLFMIWLGIGDFSKVTVIALACAVPVVIAAHNGARAVEPILLWSARARGTGERRLLWRVILPAAVPQIAAGVRTAIAVAFIVLVSSEFISSEAGLGYLVFSYGGVGAEDAMLAVVVYLAALGFALDRLYLVFLRRALAWHAFADA